MTRKVYLLLAATGLAGAVPAQAQNISDIAAELAALRSHVETLRARVAELEGARPAARAEAPAAPATLAAPAAVAAPAALAAAAPEIRFRGAPQISAPGGWSFKPRGRLQYDAGWVSSPPGLSDASLGFGNELRRARIGVEGTMPGGFGYVFEIDLADNQVEITDAILTYGASRDVSITIGQHNNFQSLEELTSSRFSSFIERAAFTDAFNFERRVGLSATWSRGALIAQAGVFTDNVGDLTNDENGAVGLDGRLVFAPRVGEAQVHLGASAHWRDSGSPAGSGLSTRYRQRPLVHFTDVRFIATPSLPVETETSYGVEAAVIRGPFHAVAEAHWLDVGTLGPGMNPSLFGGYVEAGWFITGETRGYRGGRWDRTAVRRPVAADSGGFGALQITLRYDYLDLVSGGIVGGVQNGLMAGLTWIPTDHVRFLINYGRLSYDDAAVPAGGTRDYKVDVIGARAQVDF